MARFRVTWTIDVDDGEIIAPRQAAQYAQDMQQRDRDGYWCGIFSVVDAETGEVHEIDLDAEDDTVLELTDTED